MAYVAVKGGRDAIEASIRQLQAERLKSERVLDVRDIRAGMRILVDQVMSESSVYAPFETSIAIKQAEGSPEEAVFLMRAFRSTLPRTHYSLTTDTSTMRLRRRISACFKEIPGGQILGPSFDYTHRLINFDLVSETPATLQAAETKHATVPALTQEADGNPALVLPKVSTYLQQEGLLRSFGRDDTQPEDITRRSLQFPTKRSERLQTLTRAQTGALTAFGYAAQRGYGAIHPTVGELRYGAVAVCVADPHGVAGATDANPDDAYYVGEFMATEVETLIPVSIDLGQGRKEIEFETGYGLCFGHNETKAISMSLVEHCLESGDKTYPTGDEEFVLYHLDSVEATGFISHLKLPHYVTFQSKLDSVRKVRNENKVADKGESDAQNL